MRCSLRQSTSVCASEVAGFNLDRRLLLSGIERRGLAQDRGESVGVFEIGQPAIALRLPTGDDIVQVALRELGNVFVIGHAAIDDDGGTFLEAGARAETIEHGRKCGVVAGIAGEDLVGDRESIAIDHKPNHDLFAIGALIARIAALCLVITDTQALEIG